MEFFAVADGDVSFADHVVLLPAVSYANVGQLSLDLLINTLLQGKENAVATKVGDMLSEHVAPLAGQAAFSGQPLSALCLNLEVYQVPAHKVTIIQQRSSILSGKQRAFVQDVVDWCVLNKVATLCVVSGADDMLRHDPNMISRPIYTVYSHHSSVVNRAFLEKFAFNSPSEPSDAWKRVRGTGVTPLVHAECDKKGLPFTALIMACSEGDNVPEAVEMASHLVTFLGLNDCVPSHESVAPGASRFAFPSSWSQLFGRRPDVALY